MLPQSRRGTHDRPETCWRSLARLRGHPTALPVPALGDAGISLTAFARTLNAASSARMRWRRLAPRGIGWGIADQALSSFSNFGLSFIVARTVGLGEFGAFSLALVTYSAALGVVRALSSQPFVIRFAARADRDWSSGASAATGSALAVGAVIGLCCIAGAALSSGTVGDTFAALGISMPGLLLQDTWRFAFFAHGRGRAAFENDLMWNLVQFPVLLYLVFEGRLSVLSAVLTWGLAATVAAVFGVAQSRVMPRPRLIVEWLRAHSDLGSRFIGEVIVNTASSLLEPFGIVAVAGLAANGAIRAGLLVLSPLNLLSQALILSALPNAVKTLQESPAKLVRLCGFFGMLLGATSLLWGLGVSLIPSRIGVALLRDSWEPAQTVLLPLALTYVANGLLTGAIIGVRALADANRSLRVTTITQGWSFSATIVGASRGAAVGAAWGGAAAAFASVMVWWTSLGRALADYRRRRRLSPHDSVLTLDESSDGTLPG